MDQRAGHARNTVQRRRRAQLAQSDRDRARGTELNNGWPDSLRSDLAPQIAGEHG